MAETRRLRAIESEALEELDVPEGPLVVALSGGADSAALAHLCVRAGLEPSALHVNHGLAGSERLESSARDIASALEVDLEIVAVEVSDGPSPENQARRARYAVLEQLDGMVLTAHTRNDVVETMLINMIRGTGPDGLSGIPRHRPPNIHRPMLGVSRSTTREIATLAGLPFIDDPTNRDRSLLRNHVRLDLIPLFEASNPRFVESMAATARLLSADREFLEGLAASHMEGDDVPIGLLMALARPIADRVVREMVSRAGVEPDAGVMERAWSVIAGDASRQELNRGRMIVAESGMVRVERAI